MTDRSRVYKEINFIKNLKEVTSNWQQQGAYLYVGTGKPCAGHSNVKL